MRSDPVFQKFCVITKNALRASSVTQQLKDRYSDPLIMSETEIILYLNVRELWNSVSRIRTGRIRL